MKIQNNPTFPILFSLLLCLSISCKKKTIIDNKAYSTETSACGIKNPIKNIPWLYEQYTYLQSNQMDGIILYEYEGEQIIQINSTVSSNSNGKQFRCDGTRLLSENDSAEKFDHYFNNRKEIVALFGTWRGVRSQ